MPDLKAAASAHPGAADSLPPRPSLSPAAAAAAAAPRPRDARLDVLRGLALVMIFINHVPGNPLEHWTSRNFGFSDAAEGFVFMSGLAAGLAYAPEVLGGTPWRGARRIWSRAWLLYLVHMTVTALALAISAGLMLAFDNPALIETNNVPPLLERPLETLLALPLLLHQLGYNNILPLYMVLLLVTPALLPMALRRPWALIAGAVLVWLAAGWVRYAPGTYPVEGIWFFNPLSWQLLFVLGLAAGAQLRQGRRLVPRHPLLLGAASALVVFIAVWALWDDLGIRLNAGLWWLRDVLGVPAFMVEYDKPFVSGPRLLHFLALAYVLATLPIVARIAAGRAVAPLALLGRHGLPVFAFGTVLSFLGQAVLAQWPDRTGLQLLVILAGIALQLGLAWAQDGRRRRARTAA